MPFSKHPIRGEVTKNLRSNLRATIFESREKKLFLKPAFSVFDRNDSYTQTDDKLSKQQLTVEAFAHALLFKDLVRIGLYHPKTQIMLGQNKDGKPQVLVTMPDLGDAPYTNKRFEMESKEQNQEIKKRITKLAKRFRLNTQKDLNLDVTQWHNWGRIGESHYYLDVEVLNRTANTNKLLEKYRSRARRLVARTKKQAPQVE